MLRQTAGQRQTPFVVFTLVAFFLLTADWMLAPAPTSAQEAEANVVILPPLSAEAEAAIQRAFLERNPGVAWRPEGLKLGRTTRRLWLAHARPADPAPAPADQGRALAAAGDFARSNADLLGIPAETIAGLQTGYAVERRGHEVAVVYLQSLGPIPYPGYEHLAAFGFRIDLRLEIVGETVIGVINRTDRLPDFGPLNTSPSVGPDSPTILGQMIGQELTFSDFGGEPQSAGIVGAGAIGPPVLTIEARERERVDGPDRSTSALWIGLVWRYEVTMEGDLSWTFTFNAHTAELIDIEQNFST